MVSSKVFREVLSRNAKIFWLAHPGSTDMGILKLVVDLAYLVRVGGTNSMIKLVRIPMDVIHAIFRSSVQTLNIYRGVEVHLTVIVWTVQAANFAQITILEAVGVTRLVLLANTYLDIPNHRQERVKIAPTANTKILQVPTTPYAKTNPRVLLVHMPKRINNS
jgi:hypothetical protein